MITAGKWKTAKKLQQINLPNLAERINIEILLHAEALKKSSKKPKKEGTLVKLLPKRSA
jgi:hypothetical protein